MQILTLIVTCPRCSHAIEGSITFDERLHVFDTEGFVLFGDGVVCDNCLEGVA